MRRLRLSIDRTTTSRRAPTLACTRHLLCLWCAVRCIVDLCVIILHSHVNRTTKEPVCDSLKATKDCLFVTNKWVSESEFHQRSWNIVNSDMIRMLHKSLKADTRMLVLHLCVFVILCAVQESSAGRIYFEKCEYKGFSCVKTTYGKYAITFTCNSLTTWIKRYPLTKFACVTPLKDLESLVFRNVHLDSIEREAFHNLTDMKNFTMENVTINKMHAAAIQVFMVKNSEMRIINSNFGLMEYLSIFVRGDKLSFAHNSVKEMYSNALNATVYDFVFVNNSVGWMHSAALAVLAQNVKILDSSFNYLASGSFQAVGPGLPENALRGFGRLKFIYEFNNNLIESLEVGSLHPDWQAYNNVGSVIKVTYNAIKCTCAELAWLGSKEGFGRDFSALEKFHETVLNVGNNNICSDAPCILPIEAVRMMIIQDGRCMHSVTQEFMCQQYYTTTTTPQPLLTKKNTHRFINNSIPILGHQKLAHNACVTGCVDLNAYKPARSYSRKNSTFDVSIVLSSIPAVVKKSLDGTHDRSDGNVRVKFKTEPGHAESTELQQFI
ncbi:hypothetical protein CBL_09250 [Carabus blaptoides fortunei]